MRFSRENTDFRSRFSSFRARARYTAVLFITFDRYETFYLRSRFRLDDKRRFARARARGSIFAGAAS